MRRAAVCGSAHLFFALCLVFRPALWRPVVDKLHILYYTIFVACATVAAATNLLKQVTCAGGGRNMAKFMKNINLVSRSAEVFREEKLKDCGIRGCQSKYVLMIANTPGVSQEDISRSLFVNKSNVARQISNLEQKGFVKKVENDKDRRAVLLYPTQKLMDILPRVREVLAEWRTLVTEGFTEEEKAELQRLSEKMVENAGRFMAGQD